MNDNRYWSHRTTDTGDWSHEQRQQEMIPEPWSHKQQPMEQRANDRFWSQEQQSQYCRLEQHIQETGAMNDKANTGATNNNQWSHWSNRYWSHRSREQPILEPQAKTKDTGATNDRYMRQAINIYWRLEPRATDTGATSKSYSHWSHRSNEQQILETGAATNDRRILVEPQATYRYWCHERQVQEILLEPRTTDTGATDTRAMNDNRYWRLEPQTTKPILEPQTTDT